MNALTYPVVQERLCAFILALKDVGAAPGDVRRALQQALKGEPDYLAHAVTDMLYVGVEQLIAECVPGGSNCDPQQVADSLREWVHQQEIVSGASALTAAEILAERLRQIGVEGWTPEHDDEHALGELAVAAAAYADPRARPRTASGACYVPMVWPRSWDLAWWRPQDQRRNLVKAGALILAEIDRLDRAATRAHSGSTTDPPAPGTGAYDGPFAD
ncbi:hypothetical protein [Roseateles sp.]|uniref:hypothetical protein n=1 Tax=Roseateles sp. TaxID=1971397 RepID=UPI002F41A4AB